MLSLKTALFKQNSMYLEKWLQKKGDQLPFSFFMLRAMKMSARSTSSPMQKKKNIFITEAPHLVCVLLSYHGEGEVGRIKWKASELFIEQCKILGWLWFVKHWKEQAISAPGNAVQSCIGNVMRMQIALLCLGWCKSIHITYPFVAELPSFDN